MPRRLSSPAATLVALSVLVGAGNAAVLDFEGWPASRVSTGTVAPDPASVITDQYRDLGIVFGQPGASTGVAVVSEPTSLSPSSGVNSAAGLDENGMMPGGSGAALVGDIYFRLVQPGTDVPASADWIRFTVGDSGGDRDDFILRAYDVDGALVLQEPRSGSSRFEVVLAMPGMHRVEVDFRGTMGFSLDDLEAVVAPPLACDLRTSSLASLAPPIDEAALLFTDTLSCPPSRMPPDVLVPGFTLAPDQDLPDLLLGGPPLIVYRVSCPCRGLLFVRKSGDYVHATFR